MRCVVPNCKNMSQQWLAPFPTDILLKYRWKECIEIGSGIRLPDMETVNTKQDGVCSMHFLGFSPQEDETSYRQPTLFFRDDIVLEIENCCLCCRMNVKENMLEKSDCLRGGHSIEKIAATILGSSCFDENKTTQYVCEECVVKIDMIYAFQRQIDSGKRELKKLQRRMVSENVCFQGNENVQAVKYSVEINIEIIANEAAKVIENVEEIVISQTNTKSRSTENKTVTKRKQPDDSLIREKLEKSKLKCYICGIQLESRYALLNHLMLTHTEQDALRCNECGISFKRSPEYNAHLAKHDAEARPLKCSYCPLRFAKVSGKKVHEYTYHSSENENSTNVKKPRARNYMCQICGGTYRSRSDLNRHDIVQHKGETFVTCKTCNKPFASMRNLKRHLLIHRGERPYVCEVCGASYRQSQNLVDHMNEKHRDESTELKYVCNECNERFASTRLLLSHRRTHEADYTTLASRNGGEGSNKTVCNVCGTLFDRSKLIVDHFNSEHPELQLEHYPCGSCDEVFFKKQNLLVHSYKHSDRFACDQCGNRHNTQAKLEIHRHKVHGVQIADEYFENCPHCSKKYPKGSLLARHVKTHFEGQWSCGICDKNFTEKHHLTIHTRKHTGEKPLVCTGCNERFGDPTVLSKHKKRCELFKSKHK
ncbi:zinc finger protein 436-like [Toxorhynchites rutilus septentrionalis]|uniref:zinc finger protein 436-like n=1 Tax=Toxorhynchites rutilus septentrionalis TaxID=329112 RepID=UPI0024789AD7|nr:zinc finger protein 436-like [Toxorhynchites rutilus septentrionalis]XP_055621887.1 zinc finger protein 436-like [Toxorhynchites rutilus septentrionalis]XP_055621888.1 zinc finger protein 436-like [Toxorhynchites rutilus septentrionalis]XP_055621889.1 zinc finger protein 436-like [Toxorhynchites rutilus septentrionalis]